MRLACVRFAALLLAVSGIRAGDEDETRLKLILKDARSGNQDALKPLRDLHGHPSAPATVLAAITDKRVGFGIKLRLAEIVAKWPAGNTRKMLGDWIVKHPTCSNDELMFFAGAGLPESRSVFWAILKEHQDRPGSLRNPERIALAAKGLGAFQDNPEMVVSSVAQLLASSHPHVMRSCAADALGGMRSRLALESLVSHLSDDAIGNVARCSLYRLTGTDFSDDATKWRAWLGDQGSNLPWKMLARIDFEDYLGLQKLLKPLDAGPNAQMTSFYGIEFKAKAALFILDVSGSMEFDGRINKLKAQMSNLLVGLRNKPDSLRFGIITFGENLAVCFSRGMAPNDDKSHRQAARFIDRIQAEGGTPMCAALSHALSRVLPEGNVDAIYFLSDGQPGDGTPEQVLELARRIHERFQTRIHAISIGEEPSADLGTPSLLNQVANACGGTFTMTP